MASVLHKRESYTVGESLHPLENTRCKVVEGYSQHRSLGRVYSIELWLWQTPFVVIELLIV